MLKNLDWPELFQLNEFQVFMEHLRERRQTVVDTIIDISDERQIHFLRGYASALSYVLSITAKDMFEVTQQWQKK
jgi:hypothetical protein